MLPSVQATTNLNFRRRRKGAPHSKPSINHNRPFDPVAYAAALEILG
jgi:hypothetical protein